LNDQGYLTNNRYPMDLLHLMYVAFDVLANRGGELPSINGSDCGRWYGKKADLFCFKIIGESLQQRELDSLPSLRQKLTRGLYYVLNNKPAPRTIDVDGSAFRYLLGVNSYYGGWARVRSRGTAYVFQNLLQAITPAFKTYVPVSLPQKKTQRCLIM